MTPQQYLDAEIARWKRLFVAHEAELEMEGVSNHRPIMSTLCPTVIQWAKPGTSINSIRFILSGSYLCAIGDLGDAVYQWPEIITPEFLATCEFSYMIGKLRAYPGDDGFKTWRNDAAITWAISEAHPNRDGVACPGCPQWLADLAGGPSDRDAFEASASEVYSINGDAQLASEIRSAGLVPSSTAVAQWVGLQMALHKLGYRKEAL